MPRRYKLKQWDANEEWLNDPNALWRNDPATQRQIRRLRFFHVTHAAGITKGQAADLLDAIEPTIEQLQDYDDWKVAGEPNIDQWHARSAERHAANAAARQATEALDILSELVNGEEARESGGYKKLTKAHLRQMLAYLTEHIPEWRELSQFDLGEIAVQLFPDRQKASRSVPRAYVPRVPSIRAVSLQRSGVSASKDAAYWITWGAVLCAVAVVVFLGRLYLNASDRDAQRRDDSSSADAPTPATTERAVPSFTPRPVAAVPKALEQRTSRPIPSGSAVDEAQGRAVMRFPQLGVKDSPMNRAFLERVHRHQTDHPEVFDNPEWPSIIAAEVVRP